jgi:hypothetical protein
VRLDPRCRSCGLALDRGESDYFLGAYAINLMWALTLAIGLAVAAAFLPVAPVVVYALGLPVLAALVIGAYPLSRLMWLAVDLQFRPATPEELTSRP